ncbi:hypothetical protein L873DRAFT_856504 [Choiromyces venosus 120613-1]|uniref:Uncharacterized protein n=1 Tax=Choiromyces venosus 120613-1 TaxID=1336337 RepID=A0A3N4K2G7_9PEZI|nr:hypothetical protein L873DRAFT_856504 [Choiromyces venosus 120613-1]
MIQRQFFDFGGIAYSAGEQRKEKKKRGRGCVGFFLPRLNGKSIFPIYGVFLLAATDTVVGWEEGRKEGTSRWKEKRLVWSPHHHPTTTTITIVIAASQFILRDIRNENVFALYLSINPLPPHVPPSSLTHSLTHSLSPRLKKAKSPRRGGKPIAGLSEYSGGVWIKWRKEAREEKGKGKG